MSTGLTEPERETVITTTDADELVRIWTAQRRYIGALKRNGKFTLVCEGTYGSSVWAEFTIPAAEWNPASGAKRSVTMSDERKAELAERLRAARTTQPRKLLD